MDIYKLVYEERKLHFHHSQQSHPNSVFRRDSSSSFSFSLFPHSSISFGCLHESFVTSFLSLSAYFFFPSKHASWNRAIIKLTIVPFPLFWKLGWIDALFKRLTWNQRMMEKRMEWNWIFNRIMPPGNEDEWFSLLFLSLKKCSLTVWRNDVFVHFD